MRRCSLGTSAINERCASPGRWKKTGGITPVEGASEKGTESRERTKDEKEREREPARCAVCKVSRSFNEGSESRRRFPRPFSRATEEAFFVCVHMSSSRGTGRRENGGAQRGRTSARREEREGGRRKERVHKRAFREGPAAAAAGVPLRAPAFLSPCSCLEKLLRANSEKLLCLTKHRPFPFNQRMPVTLARSDATRRSIPRVPRRAFRRASFSLPRRSEIDRFAELSGDPFPASSKTDSKADLIWKRDTFPQSIIYRRAFRNYNTIRYRARNERRRRYD